MTEFSLGAWSNPSCKPKQFLSKRQSVSPIRCSVTHRLPLSSQNQKKNRAVYIYFLDTQYAESVQEVLTIFIVSCYIKRTLIFGHKSSIAYLNVTRFRSKQCRGLKVGLTKTRSPIGNFRLIFFPN